ncbi:MAG TPA: TolC family outer membrane protein [Aquabacterium sp.]|uniref:TolC family outer membrane protein n=1 Tax=Aquabacterium sp. TaxID=1872578 RepID=UPI002E361A4E|nr:TolC family outer membrane protein [Aquabacterium sp.]HEX5355700.1 TolC family outer membrane protein [Aquabacterium sp.]
MMSKSVKTAVSPTGQRVAAKKRALAMACSAAFLSLAGWTHAQAENLVDLYQAAKGYDAAYLSAKAQAESVQYQVEQTYALLRPSLGLKGSINRSHFGADTDVPSAYAMLGQTTYNANTTTKSIALAGKMPLLNRADAAKVDQAEQSLIAAQADLTIAENDLAARLTQGYFDVLAAQDVLNTTQANKKALAEQLASAKRNFEVGNATITDTREAQARFDLASAQEIAATNDLRVKRIALDQLVGRTDVTPSPLLAPSKLDTLAPGQMDDWVAQTANAPAVRKAEVGLKVAKLEIEKAKAGHWPTLDAVANLSRSKIDSNSTSATAGSGTTALIGVELNVPLYAGGAIQNRIKEVLALSDKAERDVDNAKRSVALATRQAFSGVQSGLAQVKAYEAAEASAKLALEATQLGYRVGVRINKDVLDAQTQLTSTQKDLYKARYDVIVGSIKLKQAAGTLKADDLVDLNKLVAQ